MHGKIKDFFEKFEMPEDTQEKILEALDIVWQKDSEKKTQNIVSTKKAILDLKVTIRQQVDSVADPEKTMVKDELLEIIEEKKAKVSQFEKELERLTCEDEEDKREFMKFALSFIQDTGQHFLEPYISKDNRIRCKQMLFPDGIMLHDKEKVYTPKISVFYRGGATKKDTVVSDKVQLVRVRRL